MLLTADVEPRGARSQEAARLQHTGKVPRVRQHTAETALTRRVRFLSPSRVQVVHQLPPDRTGRGAGTNVHPTEQPKQIERCSHAPSDVSLQPYDAVAGREILSGRLELVREPEAERAERERRRAARIEQDGSPCDARELIL